MLRPRLLTPREAAEILHISYATIKHWIYVGKLRTVKTPGGHHRILEEDIEKHLRATLSARCREEWRIAPSKISESNQLVGRILAIKASGLVAQVTISIGDHRLTSIVSADVAAELGLRIGDSVVALMKASQVTILRNQI